MSANRGCLSPRVSDSDLRFAKAIACVTGPLANLLPMDSLETDELLL